MVKCIGKNIAGELRICACFMRQIKGCHDDDMKSGDKIRNNIVNIISKMDWNRTTICQGEAGNDYGEPRICLCLGEQRQESCDLKMRIVSLTKLEVIEHIERSVF